MGLQVPGIEQNYQYQNYAHGTKIPFGGLTSGPRVAPVEQVANPYGINILGQVGHVNDENGNKIGLGVDGVGLAHVDAREHRFMAIG